MIIIANFPQSASKRIFKIGQYLMQIWTEVSSQDSEVKCLVIVDL